MASRVGEPGAVQPTFFSGAFLNISLKPEQQKLY